MQPPPGPPKKSNAGKTLAIVFGSIFVLLVLLVGGCVFLVSRTSDKATDFLNDASQKIQDNTRALNPDEYELKQTTCELVTDPTTVNTDGTSSPGKTPTYEGQFTSRADGSHGFQITIGFYDGSTRIDSEVITVDTLAKDATAKVNTASLFPSTTSDLSCKVEDVTFWFG